MEEDGWNEPNLNDNGWIPVNIISGPSGTLIPLGTRERREEARKRKRNASK